MKNTNELVLSKKQMKILKREITKVVAKAIFWTILIYSMIVIIFMQEKEKAEVKSKMYVDTYTVSQGETLWGLAEKYAPETMTYDEYIYEVKKVNEAGSLNGIKAGQEINILKFNK